MSMDPIREALAKAAEIADDSDAPAQEAAVALVLRARTEPELLLIKRADAEGDPWSGHMALPGGRRDAADDDLLQTAIRETAEETGVILDAETEHLGRLADVEPNTPRLPPLRIAVHVFAVPEATSATVASREVASVYWVPLSHLRDPRRSRTVSIDINGSTRLFSSFQVKGQTVWGLTHRILTQLLEIIPPPPTPR